MNAKGCGKTAVRAEFACESSARAVPVAGDPRVLNCATQIGGQVRCREHRCGVWYFLELEDATK